MAKIRTLQIYRGTTAQNDAYTGFAGELTMDTTTNELRLHDGSTAGGHVVGSGGSGGYHPDLFDVKWADHILNDVQWLRADTFSWQSGAVYQAAYQHLLEDFSEFVDSWIWSLSGGGAVYTAKRHPDIEDMAYTDATLTTELGVITATTANSITVGGNTCNFNGWWMANDNYQTETIAGTTIQFYLADDGHKICRAHQESNVASIYSATGVAWYYIIDPSANERFKLPRTQFAFTGIRNGVGAFVEAGLPNITGSMNLTGQSNTTTPLFNSNDVASSALYNNVSITAGRYRTDSASGSGYNRIEIDASRSNSIYGNSTTVQPKATEMYLYFYVGNFTQTALENTAGLNASLFNGKADLDFANTDMIDYVVEKQDPTALNNYTWYRKYKSGWVEQGGKGTASLTVVLPVPMADDDYFITTGNDYYSASAGTPVVVWYDKTSTGFSLQGRWNGSGVNGIGCCWHVCGMAA